MLPRRDSQDLLLRLAQLAALLIASCVVVGFLRFYLEENARDFQTNFERQSFVELSRGETFVIARKLAALGKSDQIACVLATKANINFFEERNGECKPGAFRVTAKVTEPNHAIEITFVLQLPPSLLNGMILFLLAQAGIAALLLFSEKRRIVARHQHKIELAALAQNVAHDIRSPLAVLKSLSRDGVPLIQKSVERLERLISRLQGDEIETSSSLREILHSVIEEKNIEWGAALLKVSGSQSSAALLPGNAFQWRAVFSNILNNAHEASSGKQIEISIGETGGLCTISIRDQGNGIPAARLPEIGRRGFSYGKKSGKGLGLFLAKSFLSGVGGELKIDSQEGQGTEVVITVPLQPTKFVVLVDDDTELAKAWFLAGKSRNIHVEHFANPGEVLASMDGLPKEASIYIDLDFKTEADPLALGHKLHEAGYTELYICTGRAKSSVSKPDWAKEIVGKTPPWL